MFFRCRALFNVHDPAFMRNVKKAFAKYRAAMDTTPKRSVSREAFVDLDDKGAAWYLGHMKMAHTELERKLKDVDFVLEIRDARLPFTTENPNLRSLIHDKPHLIVFNKADLSNEDCNLAIQRYYESKGAFALFTSAKRTWRDTVETVRRFVAYVLPPKAFQTSAYVGLVVGMPNVGKSTLINSLRMAHEYQFHKEDFHRSRTGQTVSVHPGTTRGITMVPISQNPNVVLYDTPGITLPGNFAKEAGLKLAACGIVPTNDMTLTDGTVARYIYDIMTAAGASEHMAECMRLPRAPASFDDFTAMICERSGMSANSEMSNIRPRHAQAFVIHDFQLGKLGKVTLDRLPRKVKQQLRPEGETVVAQLTDSGAADSAAPNAEEVSAARRAAAAAAASSSSSSASGRNAATFEQKSGGEYRYTYHVETRDPAPRFPSHLRTVLEEVHYGGSAGGGAGGGANNAATGNRDRSSAGRRTSTTVSAAAAADQFVISRKKGAIQRATAQDEEIVRHTRLRPGR